MTDDVTKSTSGFAKCMRCGYSLRGLPAEHVCPECGLAYDSETSTFNLKNTVRTTVFQILITIGSLVLLPLIIAIVVIAFCLAGIPALLKRARRGFVIAITPPGLYLRTPDKDEEIIEWTTIESVEAVQDSRRKWVVSIVRHDQPKLRLGGDQNFFPTRKRADRFAALVHARVREARNESTNDDHQAADSPR